jgi:hypothetical protein
VNRLVPALTAAVVATMPSLAATQTLTECKIGQLVTDDRGQTGVIAGGRDELCLVKYKDGQTEEWEALARLRGAEPAKPGAAEADAVSSAPAPTAHIRLRGCGNL